jgi:hypothetical protein
MEKGLNTVNEPLTESTAEQAAALYAASSPALSRELARRSSGGIEVTLYWSPGDNTTYVEVWQPASEEVVCFNVPREHALDAFYHPFSHLTVEGEGWSAES